MTGFPVTALDLEKGLLEAGEIAGRIVSGVNDGGFDIVLGDGDNSGRFGRHFDNVVVIGVGLLGGLSIEESDRGCDGVP